MLSLPKIFVAALAILVSGCAATVQRPAAAEAPLQIPPASAKKIIMSVRGGPAAVASADWELLRGEWRTAMAGATAAQSIAFEYQEGAQQSTAGDGVALVVTVNDYKYISPGARYGFGIFTGNAFMDADVSFVDAKSGKMLGSRKYNTSSTAWQGIFSAMTDKQVRAICDQIVKEISAR